MATHRVTLGRYLRDFDAPCETGQLRARKRLTPWPEIRHWVPSTPGCLRATSEFLFAQSELQRQMRQAAAVEQQATQLQQDSLGGYARCSVLVSGNRLHSCGGRHQSAGAAQRRNLA